MSDYRIIMKEGGMVDIIHTNDTEKECCNEIGKLDDILLQVREDIRHRKKIISVGNI